MQQWIYSRDGKSRIPAPNSPPSDPRDPAGGEWLRGPEHLVKQYYETKGVQRHDLTRPAEVPLGLIGHPALADHPTVQPWTVRALAEQHAKRQRKLGAVSLLDALPAILVSPAPGTKRATGDLIRKAGITHWLNCAAESKLKAWVQAYGVAYDKAHWPNDGCARPSSQWLDIYDFACRALDEAAPGVKPRLLITCVHGVHRSPHVAAFLLAAFTNRNMDDAWQFVQRNYPEAQRTEPLYQSAERALRVLRGGSPDDAR